MFKKGMIKIITNPSKPKQNKKWFKATWIYFMCLLNKCVSVKLFQMCEMGLGGGCLSQWVSFLPGSSVIFMKRTMCGLHKRSR